MAVATSLAQRYISKMLSKLLSGYILAFYFVLSGYILTFANCLTGLTLAI